MSQRKEELRQFSVSMLFIFAVIGIVRTTSWIFDIFGWEAAEGSTSWFAKVIVGFAGFVWALMILGPLLEKK